MYRLPRNVKSTFTETVLGKRYMVAEEWAQHVAECANHGDKYMEIFLMLFNTYLYLKLACGAQYLRLVCHGFLFIYYEFFLQNLVQKYTI